MTSLLVSKLKKYVKNIFGLLIESDVIGRFGLFLRFYLLLTLSHFLGILKNRNRSSIWLRLFLCDIIFSDWFTGAFSPTQTETNSKFDKHLKIDNKAAAITFDCCTRKTSEVIFKNAAYYRDTIFCCKNTIFQIFEIP